MTNKTDKAHSNPIALFVSDVHLQQALPRTTAAFLAFLSKQAPRAKHLYLLGDLFEYWAGDDDIGSDYNQQIVGAMRNAAAAGVNIFWIGGNRDFLVSIGFAASAGIALLPDPHVVELAGRRIVLTHGDAQCTDDLEYMAFRSQVRQEKWQRQFLAMPLAQRKAIIDGLRNSSREAQQGKSYEIMDVNRTAIAELFDSTSASIMVHGHTHRPGSHEYRNGTDKRVRHVLPDWDCDGEHLRGGWLALSETGEFTFFDTAGNECVTAIRTAS